MATVESCIDIQAPVARVMALARDIERFPEFMRDIKQVLVLERDGGRVVSRWVARAEDIRITLKWTEEDLWDEAAGTCHFHQIEGDYGRMEGVWTFQPVDGGTRFQSTLTLEYDVPLIGPLIKSLVAKKARENLDATLAAIKARAESSAP